MTLKGFSWLVVVIAFFMGVTIASVYWPERQPRYFEGVITGKQWIPAHTTTDTTYVVGPNNTMIPIFTTTDVPDKWFIFIHDDRIRVTKEEFVRIEIGQPYSNRPKPAEGKTP